MCRVSCFLLFFVLVDPFSLLFAQEIEVVTKTAEGVIVSQGTLGTQNTGSVLKSEPLNYQGSNQTNYPFAIDENVTSVNMVPLVRGGGNSPPMSLMNQFPEFLEDIGNNKLYGEGSIPYQDRSYINSLYAQSGSSQDPYIFAQDSPITILSANPFYNEVNTIPPPAPPVAIVPPISHPYPLNESIAEFSFRLRPSYYPIYVFRSEERPTRRSMLKKEALINTISGDPRTNEAPIYRASVRLGRRVYYTFINSYNLAVSEDFYLNPENSQQFYVNAGINSNYNAGLLNASPAQTSSAETAQKEISPGISKQEQYQEYNTTEDLNAQLNALSEENNALKQKIMEDTAKEEAFVETYKNGPLTNYTANDIPFITILPEEQRAMELRTATPFTLLIESFIKNQRQNVKVLRALDFIATQSPAHLNKARFYRAQIYALKGQFSKALGEFLQVQPHYPQEASIWIEHVKGQMAVQA